MSPVVFEARGLRFGFYSGEESRIHVHVRGGGGKAKFWIEPAVELVYSRGMTRRTLRVAMDLIKERKDEISAAWKAHLSGKGDRDQ